MSNGSVDSYRRQRRGDTLVGSKSDILESKYYAVYRSNLARPLFLSDVCQRALDLNGVKRCHSGASRGSGKFRGRVSCLYGLFWEILIVQGLAVSQTIVQLLHRIFQWIDWSANCSTERILKSGMRTSETIFATFFLSTKIDWMLKRCHGTWDYIFRYVICWST